jgi:hypothetical protein
MLAHVSPTQMGKASSRPISLIHSIGKLISKAGGEVERIGAPGSDSVHQGTLHLR